MVEPSERLRVTVRGQWISVLNFGVTILPGLDQFEQPPQEGGERWEATMSKKPRRVSRRPRLKLLPAVNQADRWVLLPGGGFGLRSAA
jgi:hypothetical protein